MSLHETQPLDIDDLYRLHPSLLQETSRAYSMIENLPATRVNTKPRTLNGISVNAGLEHVLGKTRHSFKAFLRNDEPLVTLPSFQPALAHLAENGGHMKIALLDAAPSEQLAYLKDEYSQAMRIVLARTGEAECTFSNAAISDGMRAYEWDPPQNKAVQSSLYLDKSGASSIDRRLNIIWKALTGEEPDRKRAKSWIEKLTSKFPR